MRHSNFVVLVSEVSRMSTKGSSDAQFSRLTGGTRCL